MAESDFLSLLLEETLNLPSKPGIDLSSLELKLKDYSLTYLRGFFIPQSQVLRFETPFGVLDFPTNWSSFTPYSHLNGVMLTADEDPDHLFKILQTNWDTKIQKLLITHADGYCYLIGLKVGEENHLHDLLNPQEWLKAA